MHLAVYCSSIAAHRSQASEVTGTEKARKKKKTVVQSKTTPNYHTVTWHAFDFISDLQGHSYTF